MYLCSPQPFFIPADQNRYCANNVDPDEKIKSIFIAVKVQKGIRLKYHFNLPLPLSLD